MVSRTRRKAVLLHEAIRIWGSASPAILRALVSSAWLSLPTIPRSVFQSVRGQGGGRREQGEVEEKQLHFKDLMGEGGYISLLHTSHQLLLSHMTVRAASQAVECGHLRTNHLPNLSLPPLLAMEASLHGTSVG